MNWAMIDPQSRTKTIQSWELLSFIYIQSFLLSINKMYWHVTSWLICPWLKTMSLPVHDHASNSNWLSSVHFCWGFTVKVNGSDTVKWFWIVQNRNSMLFTHWKHIEIPSISGQGDVSHYELFPVFINVLIKPSPFSITNVIEIRISIEPKIE